MTLDEYFSSLRGKRIGVVGIGVSNRPLIRLLAGHGCRVTACDRRTREQLGGEYDSLTGLGVSLRLGEGYIDELDFDVIFRTPGLHPRELTPKMRPGAVLTSEMEVFFALCPCRTIAITGSDGKTTTSTLTAEMLRAAGHTVYLGGNIGTPLLELVPEMREGDIAVLELSSFQLHSMTCRPDVAVVTNIFPNHLDVHPSYADYIDAKKSVFRGQTADDTLVLNADNELAASFAGEAKSRVVWFSRQKMLDDGCCCENGELFRFGRRVMAASEVRLPGVHNIENMLAAFAATEGLVSDEQCREVAAGFGGVAHRLELVRERNGVRYYNDSIASSPTRTIAGLRSFAEKPILIAGGHDKHVPFDGLARETVQRCRAVFLTGETARAIEAAIAAVPGEKPPVFVIDGFRDAVLAAADFAESGDVVLLSPACSSFDRFRNFEERGNAFRKIVEEMG